MKRKNSSISPLENRSFFISTEDEEKNCCDDMSLKETIESYPADRVKKKKKVAVKKSIWDRVRPEQVISAIRDLGVDKKEIDNESWRKKDLTSSRESVWARLISKLGLSQTESVQRSLYDFWRRNREEIVDSLSQNQIDSIEENDKSAKENELSLPSLSSGIKPLASNTSIPYPVTRAEVKQQLTHPTITEASFILSFKQWRELYDNSKREMRSGWTSVIYEKVCSCSFRCVLTFERHHIALENTRKKNSSFFRSIASCKLSSCERTFEIFIRDEPIKKGSIVVRIRAAGDESHSADAKAVARHLTGKDRLAVGKAANTVGILKVFQEKIEVADEKMLSARNFTGCETTEVIKHAAADYRKHFQLDEDIFRECRIRQQLLEETDVSSVKIKGYVQVIGEKPFRLHLTSEMQISRYAKYCFRSKYSHVYIDATGSIVKSLPHQKTILLYAAIFKDGDDPSNVIPLGHAILADHTTASISYFLGTLRQGIITMKDKVIRPSFFVTDFSPAIFNAILQAFNQEDIRSHLKRCWNVLLRKYDAKELRSRSFLRFCCSHMMHTFARSLSAANVAKEIRKKLMHLFALFINCGELEQSFKFLKRVLHIFGNPQATDTEDILHIFLEAPYDADDISEKIGPCDIDVPDDSTDPLNEVDENMHSSKTIIHESPFNIEAIRRFPELSKLLDSKSKYENVTNSLFSRRVIYVFYKWFAYLPLWTSLLTQFEDRYSIDRTPVDIQKYEQGRLSNAQIECYFGILKDSTLERKTNLRPAEVIVSLYRTVQIQLKADKFGVSQIVKSRKGKPKDMNDKESWGKKGGKKKKRNAYLSPIDKRNQKQVESKTVSPELHEISRKPEPFSPRRESFSPRPESFSPGSALVDPRPEPACMQPKVVSPKSQPSLFATLTYITSHTQERNDYILNNLSNSGLPHYSLDFSPSKSADSFCGRNPPSEKDFFIDSSVASVSGQPMSQLNIFSAIECDNQSINFPDSKNTTPPFESEIKRQNITNKQEQHKHRNKNVTSKNIRRRLPSHEIIETFDSSPVCRNVTIEQCLFTWPAFGIKEKNFAGRSYSVTNTCNIDSPLFILYVIFRTESNIKNTILNCEKEPFLTLRETFKLVNSASWDEARLHWLMSNGLLSSEQSNNYNAYGSVDKNALRFMKSHLQSYKSSSLCSRKDCPMRERKIISTEIALEYCETDVLKFSKKTTSNCGVFMKTVEEISVEEANRLGYKQYTRKIMNVDANTMEDQNGWLCNGNVVTEPSYFINGPPPFLFMDVVHPTMDNPNSKGIMQTNLNFHNIQRTITVGSSTYTLRATINHHADHFTATIVDSTGHIFIYNDLEGVEEVDQSLFCVETAVYVLKN